MRQSAASDNCQVPDTLWTTLETQAGENPTKVAFRVLDNSLREQEIISYGDLRSRAESKAALLSERGLAGTPIGLIQSTSLNFIISFFAILRGGGTVIPLNPRSTIRQGEDLRPLLEDARPVALLSNRATAAKLTGAIAELGFPCLSIAEEDLSERQPGGLARRAIAADNPAVLQYTSGSTSRPKGVCISHANFLANARILSRVFDAGADDIAVSWLPLFHDMGLMTGVVWPVVTGASAVLLKPSTFSARPATWLKALSNYRGTISAAPNFAYQLCADRVSGTELSGVRLADWRVAICGAEPVNPLTVQQFLDRVSTTGFDPRCFYPSYGLAEATLFVSGFRPSTPPRILSADAAALESNGKFEHSGLGATPRQLVACGAPAPNLEVTIVDPQTQRQLPEKSIGEIWIRGPSVSAGYLKQDRLTDAVFRAVIVDDENRRSFLRTGDLGFFEGGELFVTGRLKDLIIVRGAKYAPQDLELTCARALSPLKGHRGVAFAVETVPEGGVAILQEVPDDLGDLAFGMIDALISAVGQSHGLSLHAVDLLPPRTLPLTSSGKVRRGPTRTAWLAGELPTVASWRAERDTNCLHPRAV